MKGVEKPSLPNPNSKSTLCEECHQNPSKYTCPGCSLRSCSLPCVKSHKQHTSCTGKRSRTAFVPLSNFDDNLLISGHVLIFLHQFQIPISQFLVIPSESLSFCSFSLKFLWLDYNFLEETKRAAESAQRMRRGLFSNRFRLPFRLKLLRDAACQRKTRLLLLSSGMEMREKNQSMFNQRKKSIFWTIEWRFHSTDVVLIDHGVDEHICPDSVIEKHLNPSPWNHQLRPFCNEPLESLKFFIRKNPKGQKMAFRELDVKVPIRPQLVDVVIVEYPVIHVFLSTHSYEFEVEKYTNILSKNVEATEPLIDIPSPKGVLFREEEINEDDAVFDTQVLDFMNYMNEEPQMRDRMVEKETNFSARASEVMKPAKENGTRASKGGEMNGHFLSNSALEAAEDVDFEFQQDLRDAYSGLIKQANPDDFLCYDGFAEEVDGSALRDEELEEGEIVEF